jgi:hypothetical protein
MMLLHYSQTDKTTDRKREYKKKGKKKKIIFHIFDCFIVIIVFSHCRRHTLLITRSSHKFNRNKEREREGKKEKMYRRYY